MLGNGQGDKRDGHHVRWLLIPSTLARCRCDVLVPKRPPFNIARAGSLAQFLYLRCDEFGHRDHPPPELHGMRARAALWIVSQRLTSPHSAPRYRSSATLRLDLRPRASPRERLFLPRSQPAQLTTKSHESPLRLKLGRAPTPGEDKGAGWDEGRYPTADRRSSCARGESLTLTGEREHLDQRERCRARRPPRGRAHRAPLPALALAPT